MSNDVATYYSQLAGLVSNARQGLASAAGGTDPLAAGASTSTNLLDAVPQVQTPQFAAPQTPTPQFVQRGANAIAQARQVTGGAAAVPADLAKLGVTPEEAWIIRHESGGNVMARNPTPVYSNGQLLGHAFGLGQLVDSNRAAIARSLGIRDPNTTNPAEQLAMMRAYIRGRYGNAANAVAFWQRSHWY